MINYDGPLNNRGNNANLVGKVLDDETMTANEFRRTIRGSWQLWENLGHNISLTITVSVAYLCINVIDEDFLQPYDYQDYLRNINPGCAVPLEIHRKVQNTMRRLSSAGIIEGWVANDYI